MKPFQRQQDNNVFSSSPGFGTPVHPLPPTQIQRPPPPPAFKPAIQTILPTLLPPGTIRPLAFRVFTKKHNLALHTSALQALAAFTGRHCGSGWREEGTGEKVLEEVARIWKLETGPVIVEDCDRLRKILKALEGCLSGGRIEARRGSPQPGGQDSFAFDRDIELDSNNGPQRPSLDGLNSSFGLSKLEVEEEDDDEASKDPRAWFKVISSFEQPRLWYDNDKRHFTPQTKKTSMFPSPSQKTKLIRERYNIIYQRLLRNEAFQAPSFTSKSVGLSRNQSSQQFYKITQISNLLGRGGSSHVLLGMLAIAPTGTLALNDLSGSIHLDLQHAQPLQGENSAYFCPGMIVLVDGVYEEDWAGAGSSGLGNTGGVGGTIGGRFLGFSIGGPPVEKRNLTLGVNLHSGDVGGGFGWTDFLGLGSDRAVGERMRRLEKKLVGSDDIESSSPRRKTIMLSEVNLDQPQTLAALRKVLELYAAADEPPMSFVLTGNFSSKATMAGAGVGSIEYKEIFNEMAAVLSDFPSLLRRSTWVFVPGDNDPWSSAFSAGASTLIPRDSVPDPFISRIKRAFANAKSDTGAAKKDELDGEAIWTSNPTRLSLFGPTHEVLIFRDDLSGRFRRNAVRIGQATVKADGGTQVEEPPNTQTNGDSDMEQHTAMISTLPTTEDIAFQSPPADPTRSDSPTITPALDDYPTAQAKKLILSLLPQSTLSPFPQSIRPVHWDYASSLSLYPLPHTLVLADAESAPFAMTFEGCHVINLGRLVSGSGRRKRVRWVEYDGWAKRGTVREEWVG